MSAGFQQEVERFLLAAFDPEHEFPALEWADEAPAPTPSRLEELQRRAWTPLFGGKRLPARFEPPMVRLHCTHCGNSWDAWVEDDGTLQDERDRYCGETPECDRARVEIEE